MRAPRERLDEREEVRTDLFEFVEDRAPGVPHSLHRCSTRVAPGRVADRLGPFLEGLPDRLVEESFLGPEVVADRPEIRVRGRDQVTGGDVSVVTLPKKALGHVEKSIAMALAGG